MPTSPYSPSKDHYGVERSSGCAIARGFIVFLATWAILGMAAHVFIPLDSTGNPALDKETDRIAMVVGPITIGISALLGLGGVSFFL